MRNHRLARLSWVLAGFAACPVIPASANGFFVPQQSAQGLGRAHANVAAARDPSTVFFNPAGMTRLFEERSANGKDWIASIGTNVIMPTIDFDDSGTTVTSPGSAFAPVPTGGGDGGNPASPTPVPHAYLVRSLVQDRLYFGLAFNAPFGLETDYGSDWFGRYDSIKARLVTIDVAPSLALKVNEHLSIGGGVNIQRADALLVGAVPDPLAPGGPTPDTDGRNRFEARDITVGFNVGLLANITDRTAIGLHYRSEMNHDLDGTLRLSGLTGPLAALNDSVSARADLDLPDVAAIGIMHEVNDRLTILAEAQWFGWDDLTELRIKLRDGSPDAVRPLDYRNSYTLSLAGEYQASSRLRLRGGLQYDRTPTRDATRGTIVPDGDRVWIAGGATYTYSDSVSLDIALTHVPFRDADVDVVRTFFDDTPLQTSVGVRGTAETNVTTVTVGLQIRF